MGPQVGYYIPQILMEIDLHGPGIDARGAASPASTSTSSSATAATTRGARRRATTDNVDTFAEVLCQDDFHYMLEGRVPGDGEARPHATPGRRTLNDQTPAGSETLTAYRTVHGIVYARGTVKGRRSRS